LTGERNNETLKQVYQVETFARNSKNFEDPAAASQNRYSEYGGEKPNKIPVYVASQTYSKVNTNEGSEAMNPGSTFPVSRQTQAKKGEPVSSTAEAPFDKIIEEDTSGRLPQLEQPSSYQA